LRRRFPGECARELRGVDEPGSGCDFLHFHRRMLRHFYFVLAATPVDGFSFQPWTGERLPDWVESAIADRDPSFDLDAAYRKISEFVAGDDVDALGSFLEGGFRQVNTPGAGLHAQVHFAVAYVETKLYPGDTTVLMSQMGPSVGNVFFWTLHAWIDGLYAEWQRRHGQAVDVSPTKMKHVHVEC
jgi:hypothetical protein